MANSLFTSVRGKRDSIESTIEDQIEQLKSELATLTDRLRDKGAEQGKWAKKRAESGLEDLMASGEDILQELRDVYQRSGAEVRSTVRRHPLATIGAAAAVGILLALVARR